MGTSVLINIDTMAFNYVPKSAEEILQKKKLHSLEVAKLFSIVKLRYQVDIILDPNTTYQFVKISRDLEARGVPIFDVRATLAAAGVDVKKLKIEYGTGSVNVGAGIGSAIETKKQEEGSLLYFEKYIEERLFPSFTELKKVYPNVDDTWIKTFEGQARGLKQYLGPERGYNYYRETGIMKQIELVAKQMGVRKKDSWNPADVYIVSKQHEQKIKNELNEVLNQYLSGVKDIKVLNDYMRSKLKAKELIGISLKKLAPTQTLAKVEEVNVDEQQPDYQQRINHIFKLKQITCNLDIENEKLKTKDLAFTIGVGDGSVPAQVRGFPGQGARETVQTELTKYTGGARLGKVPSSVIDNFFFKNLQKRVKGSELPVVGKWKKEDFDMYKALFTDVYKYRLDGVSIDWGVQITTPEQFEAFLVTSTTLEQKSTDYANRFSNKLQALHYISSMMRFDQKGILNDFLACLFYGSQKQTSDAGPFIKLY